MVVEDELDLLSLVERYLRLWKYDTQGFTDPVKALEAFRANPSQYSVVMTDIRMAGLSGTELAEKMIELKPDAKIVLMTAYEVTNQMLSGLPMVSHSDIVKKPFRIKEICESVKRQLQIQC
jgi:DNA-binding NtrC family response regulator